MAKINIWESFDFKKIDEEIEEKYKDHVPYNEQYKVYFDIINGEISTLIGDVEELQVECDDRGINILINRSQIFDVLIKDNKYIIYTDRFDRSAIPIELDNLDVFMKIIREVIIKKIIPELKEDYKSGYVKELPEKIKPKVKINFSKLTKKWLKSKFYEISSEHSNSETIENIKIKNGKKKTKITFDVDCDRYGLHRGNEIIINDKGGISNTFSEIIEGGDIDGRFIEEIEKYIS